MKLSNTHFHKFYKAILFLGCFLNYTCVQHAYSFTFSGLLPFVSNETVKVQYYATQYQSEINEASVIADHNGAFKLSITMREGQVIIFGSNKKIFRFYADPNDSLFVRTKSNDANNAIIFSGIGAMQADFVYQKSEYFYKNLESPARSHDMIVEMSDRTADGFKKYCDSVFEVKLKYLNKYKSKLTLAFYQWQLAEEMYEAANFKINYPTWYYSMRGIENKQLPVDSAYYNFLNQMVISNDNAVSSSQYRNFMKYFLINRFAQRKQNPEAMEAYRQSILFFKDKALQTFRLQLWNEIILYGQFSDATSMYTMLSVLYGNEPDFKLLKAKYSEKLPFSEGAPAPAFELPDLAGKKISLASLKGKVVYIDFWASWCGPCLAEMPGSERLKEHFAGLDVVFVNISIDQNEQAWRNSVEKNKITGINLLANSTSDITAKYKISSIPAYFLIDKEGKFISAPASRPGRDIIYKQIEEGLKK